MSTSRSSYDELGTPAEMRADCRAAGDRLGLRPIADRPVTPPPSLRYDDVPSQAPQPDATVREAAARLAATLYER